MIEGPRVERVRHELKRRRLSVARVERRPPNLVRVVLKGDELRGFTSLGFDDHIKLFFPRAGATEAAMRDFTPRRYDAAANELWVDFFLHDGGPAATWAAQAAVGQAIEIGGPKGSAVIPIDEIDTHVFVGDETAVPAIGRRLEELPSSARAVVFIEVDADAERPVLGSRAPVEDVWVERPRTAVAPGYALIDALRRTELPPGRSFFWVAAESRAARTIRNHLRDERGVGKHWIKAAGYWQQGAAGAHERIADD